MNLQSTSTGLINSIRECLKRADSNSLLAPEKIRMWNLLHIQPLQNHLLSSLNIKRV